MKTDTACRWAQDSLYPDDWGVDVGTGLASACESVAFSAAMQPYVLTQVGCRSQLRKQSLHQRFMVLCDFERRAAACLLGLELNGREAQRYCATSTRSRTCTQLLAWAAKRTQAG